MTHPLAWSFGRLWHSFGVVLFVAVGILSVGVLGWTRQRLQNAAEQAVVATDNVMGARTSVLRAEMALASAPPGASPSGDVIAELDNAAARLSDLREGRSALYGFEADRLAGDPVASLLVDSVSAGVENLRALIADSSPPATDLQLRLAFGDLRSASARLERHVHETVRAQLAAERRTQTVLLVAWGLFLALTGLAVELLRRARMRAIRQGAVAEEGRRTALAERDESERRLQNLRTLMDAGLLLVDDEGRIREMSRWWARSLSMTEREWVGRFWWEFFQEDERDRLFDLWRDKAARRISFALEGRPLASDDRRELWLSGRWRPVEANGEASDGSWVGTFLDVSQMRSVETQLHQAQKLEAVGRMTSGVAHDFNNLLTVIRTNAELLREPAESEEEREELIEDIERSAASGRELIASLMRFSRREDLQIVSVDLSEVVRGATRMATKLLTDGIELATELPKPGPVVHADSRALEQILLNLVSNARDAMPEGGQLVVSVDQVEADGSFVEERPWIEPGRFGRVTVTDTGTGMDRETLDRIFEPFFSTKPEGVGTGLGLASAHGLVRQHGGHIHAYSEVGVGTSFRVYLPAAEQDVGTPPRPAPSTPRPAPTSGSTSGHEGASPITGRRRLRVLLVEDDEALRRTSERVLVRMGHEVRSVDSADEALDLLRAPSPPFDLVISDISMDRVDGIELVRRSRAAGVKLPFVLTSGRHASQLVGTSALPDDVAFLPKPWSVRTLQDAIRDARKRA